MSKIMLIDDDPTMLALLTTLLEMEGHTVNQWNGQLDILGDIRGHQPDMILLDIHLKSASGFDVITGIREDETLKSTRVIMSSGMDYRIKCMELGANHFLPKPYMPDDLIKIIQEQESAI